MYTIRLATTSDLPQLSTLLNEYRIFYKQPADLAGATGFLRERMEKEESVIYVAEEGDLLRGFVQLYPLFSSVLMKRTWLLNDLFVAVSHRGKGISRDLIGAGKHLAIKTGAGGLLLKTAKTNVPGNSLYPSEGFLLDIDFNAYWWPNSTAASPA